MPTLGGDNTGVDGGEEVVDFRKVTRGSCSTLHGVGKETCRGD